MAKKPKKKKEKPQVEIDLMLLQSVLLQDRFAAESWDSMFPVMINYARSIVLKTIKGKVFLEPDHVLGVATDAAIKIMERYRTDPEFFITDSFGGLLRWKVIESLYGDFEEDNHSSLNFVVGNEGGHITELGDLQSSVGTQNVMYKDVSLTQDLDKTSSQDVMKDTLTVLTEFDDSVDNYRLKLLGRLCVLLTLRKSKVRHSLQVFKNHMNITPREDEVLDLLVLEIRNRLI